jgi:hypothetical protein
LVRAMKQLKECSFEEYQEKMMNEGMSGSLDELNQLRMYAYVAGFLNQIPHTILTESTKKDKEIE